MNKFCPKCKKTKDESAFFKDKSHSSGLAAACKVCRKSYNEKNAEQLKTWRRAHYLENKSKILLQNKANRPKYNERRAAQIRERSQTDPLFKLTNAVRCRLRHALRATGKGTVKIATTLSLLGCSPAVLKTHIENQFEPGMTWDNHGLHGWHVDHIKPCAKFDLTKEAEQMECFHYSNLQPLWAEDNLKKGSKDL
ncbi:MAG: hypothetical protein WCL71_03575 [Deltaproteobacteria bacterium]